MKNNYNKISLDLIRNAKEKAKFRILVVINTQLTVIRESSEPLITNTTLVIEFVTLKLTEPLIKK